jgi:tetratricopeptide (TPR) repeat protein
LAIAHYQRGACWADLGDYDSAIEAYRRALDVQRAHPYSLTTAHTAFAELVVTLNRRQLFSEVLTALDEFSRVDAFPMDIFKGQTARALIAADAGDIDAARVYAKQALVAAAATESGFRYHKTLGLVGFVDPKLVDRLRELSAA